jgi:hypothetical protein
MVATTNGERTEAIPWDDGILSEIYPWIWSYQQNPDGTVKKRGALRVEF